MHHIWMCQWITMCEVLC